MNLQRLALLSIAASAALLSGCGVLLDARNDRLEAEAEARTPPEGRFTEVAGRRVHYVQKGRGPDVILIHGAGGNTRDWTFSFMDRLTDRYRVTAFDRPGLGYTDRTSDAYGGAFNTRAESPVEQARFLAAAARQLGIRRPIIVGQSYGGAVALGWALEEEPAALVLVSATSNPWEGSAGVLYDINASALGGAGFVPVLTAFTSQDRVDETLKSLFSPQPVPAGYGAYFGTGLSLRREALRASSRQVQRLKADLTDMVPRYGDVDIPVEILHGTADTIVGAQIHSVPLSNQIAGARLTLLPGIGHMPHHVAPLPVVSAIDRAASRAGLR